jgi:hypothetical protein
MKSPASLVADKPRPSGVFAFLGVTGGWFGRCPPNGPAWAGSRKRPENFPAGKFDHDPCVFEWARWPQLPVGRSLETFLQESSAPLACTNHGGSAMTGTQ